MSGSALAPQELEHHLIKLRGMLPLRPVAASAEHVQVCVRHAAHETQVLIRNLIERVRADGFGSIHADWAAQSKIGAVAVSILLRERVLASLNVVFLSRAVTLAQAKRPFVPDLKLDEDEMVMALEAEEDTSRASKAAASDQQP